MISIPLSSPADIAGFLSSSLAGETEYKDISLELDPALKRLRIRLVGDQYHSTISTNLMRGVLRLQDLVYDLYSLYKYGTVSRLTAVERKELELMVYVEQGSSILEIAFEKIMEALTKLTPRQIMAVAGIVGLAAVATTSVTAFADYRKEIDKATIEAKSHSEDTKLLQDSFKLVVDAQRDFLRVANREQFQELQLNGIQQTQGEIKEVTTTKRVRHESSEVIYTGLFRIVRIDIDDSEGTFIDVKHIESGTIINRVNILADFIKKDDYQWIKDAVDEGKGKPVSMVVSASVKNGKVQSATLRSIDQTMVP